MSLSAMALISPRMRPQTSDLLHANPDGLGDNDDFSLSQSLDALISPRYNSPAEEYRKGYDKTHPNVNNLMKCKNGEDVRTSVSYSAGMMTEEDLVTAEKQDTVIQ